jgi:hypothetical protein
MSGRGGGGSGWQTVKNPKEDKKQRAEERRKAEVKKDRLGVPVGASGPFAAFDAAYAAQGAADAQRKVAAGAGPLRGGASDSVRPCPSQH